MIRNSINNNSYNPNGYQTGWIEDDLPIGYQSGTWGNDSPGGGPQGSPGGGGGLNNMFTQNAQQYAQNQPDSNFGQDYGMGNSEPWKDGNMDWGKNTSRQQGGMDSFSGQLINPGSFQWGGGYTGSGNNWLGNQLQNGHQGWTGNGLGSLFQNSEGGNYSQGGSGFAWDGLSDEEREAKRVAWANNPDNQKNGGLGSAYQQQMKKDRGWTIDDSGNWVEPEGASRMIFGSIGGSNNSRANPGATSDEVANIFDNGTLDDQIAFAENQTYGNPDTTKNPGRNPNDWPAPGGNTQEQWGNQGDASGQYNPTALGSPGPGGLDVLQWASRGGMTPQVGYDINQLRNQMAEPTTLNEQSLGNQQQGIIGQGGLQDLYEGRGLAAMEGKQLNDPNKQYYEAVTDQMNTNRTDALKALKTQLGEEDQLYSGEERKRYEDFLLKDLQQRNTVLSDLQKQESDKFGSYLQQQSQQIPQYMLSNKGLQQQITNSAADLAKTLGISQVEAAKNINNFALQNAGLANKQADLMLQESMNRMQAQIAKISSARDQARWEYEFPENFRNMMTENSQQWVQTFQDGLMSNLLQNMFSSLGDFATNMNFLDRD